eukprot:scaffold287_cov337-Pavlova_lutheri.AAC.169
MAQLPWPGPDTFFPPSDAFRVPFFSHPWLARPLPVLLARFSRPRAPRVLRVGAQQAAHVASSPSSFLVPFTWLRWWLVGMGTGGKGAFSIHPRTVQGTGRGRTAAVRGPTGIEEERRGEARGSSTGKGGTGGWKEREVRRCSGAGFREERSLGRGSRVASQNLPSGNASGSLRPEGVGMPRMRRRIDAGTSVEGVPQRTSERPNPNGADGLGQRGDVLFGSRKKRFVLTRKICCGVDNAPHHQRMTQRTGPGTDRATKEIPMRVPIT